jgi:hypothetical protein
LTAVLFWIYCLSPSFPVVAMKKQKRTSPGAAASKQGRAATVVDLGAVRQRQRRALADKRVRAVLEENRAAVTRLFGSGLLFTQTGSRNGRELLGAHQALLKLVDQIARLDEAALSGRQRDRELDEVFRQLDQQLVRATQLTARTGEFLAGRGRE